MTQRTTPPVQRPCEQHRYSPNGKSLADRTQSTAKRSYEPLGRSGRSTASTPVLAHWPRRGKSERSVCTLLERVPRRQFYDRADGIDTVRSEILLRIEPNQRREDRTCRSGTVIDQPRRPPFLSTGRGMVKANGQPVRCMNESLVASCKIVRTAPALSERRFSSEFNAVYRKTMASTVPMWSSIKRGYRVLVSRSRTW